MPDEEMERLLVDPGAYRDYLESHPLPDPSPSCQECHKHDGWTEAQLDAEIARLKRILELAA
jgi:hypothetical protein